jgi:hypothetical protein
MLDCRPNAARGVYRLNEILSPEGFPIFLAVSRDGRRLAERIQFPFESDCYVIAELRDELDALDPGN